MPSRGPEATPSVDVAATESGRSPSTLSGHPEVPTSRLRGLAQRPLLVGSLISGLALAVYSPAVTFDFLAFDDDYFVWQNAWVRAGLVPASVKWAFTSTWGFWFPLTRLSHLVDATLWGPRPGGHHLTNILLHAASAALVFSIMRRLTGSSARGAVVALLFALHPLNVEPVAWISERKGVLCGTLFLLALRAWLSYCARPGAARLAAVVALYLAALMAKPMALTLPGVLILLDGWPLRRFWIDGRFNWRCLWEKVPFLVLAVVFSVLTYRAQDSIGATADLNVFPLDVRAANTLTSYARYLRLVFVPADLAAFYPHPYRHFVPWRVAGAAAVLVGVSALLVALRKSRPHLLMGWCWWLGMLVPVIGLVQIGRQGMADHYAYLPSLGLFLALVTEGADRLRSRPWVGVAVAGVVLAAAAVLTSGALGAWADTETLFLAARDTTGPNWLADSGLARIRRAQGRLDEAESLAREAVATLDQDAPIRARVRLQLAEVLWAQRHREEARAEFATAQAEAPLRPDTCAQMASLAEAWGDVPEARRLLALGVSLAPAEPAARLAEAALLLRLGAGAEAIAILREGVRQAPGSADLFLSLGRALWASQRWDEAEAAWETAARLDPGSSAIRDALKAARDRRAPSP